MRVPFTYDEAASYIRYIDSSVPSAFDTNALSVFNFEVATNHFLNTALTKLAYVAGGRNELALRLPNVLGYALYLGFAALILRRLSNPLIGAAGFLLLNLNPYVLDFFALSRGYGLSLGLLMASLFFLLRVIERPTEVSHTRDLSRALAFAVASVMASFALLNVYLSVIAVLVLAFVITNRRAGWSEGIEDDKALSRRAVVVCFVSAALFIPLVFSQDAGLSDALYEPVVISLNGLDEAALDHAKVLRRDIHGRESALLKEPGLREWSSRGRTHFRGLTIELPRRDADSLSQVEVVIGSRAFSFNPQRSDWWTVREMGETRAFESTHLLSLGRSHVPAFRSVINWAGDSVYYRQLILATGVALLILGASAVLLNVVGRLVSRARLIRPPQWRTLSGSLLWVGALAGAPLYLLKRNSELYFGGTRGIVQDTFTSIVHNSFYGRTYNGAQVSVVLGLVAVIVAIFSVVLARTYRRGSLSTVVPAIVVLAVLLISSCSLVVQHLVLQTVYLAGRTALFYIPLFVLFFCFVCDAMSRTGRTGRLAALALMSVTVALSVVHFSRTANMKYVFDWKDDASTKRMIADVQQFAGASSPHVTLGLAPIYAPVAVYYTRLCTAPVDVVVVPSAQETSFLYEYDRERPVPRGDIVSRYPLTHTDLERVRR